MTLEKLLERGMDRAGLDTGDAGDKTQALGYFNDFKDETISIRPWLWSVGEASITTVKDQQDYTLEPAGAVLVRTVFSARDTTNNRPLIVTEVRREDLIDPDEDFKADAKRMFVSHWVAGTTSTTVGFWKAHFRPIPGAAGAVIKYRFYKYFADKTSSNYTTSLDTEFPVWIQRAGLHYIGGYLAGEKGNLALQQSELQLAGGGGFLGQADRNGNIVWGGMIGRAISVDEAATMEPDIQLRRSPRRGKRLIITAGQPLGTGN